VRQLFPFILVGLTAGSVYAIAGMGLVLTYQTSGVFNFAHGAQAAVGAYVFYELRVQRGVPWPLALVATVVACGLVLGLALERLSRVLAGMRPSDWILATVGLLLGIQGAATVVYGAEVRSFPAFLPSGTFTLAGLTIGVDQLIVMLVAAAVAGGLFVFFRASRLGLAMRAVVDDPDLLALDAVSPAAVRRWAWIAGSAFAAASGVLIAPTLGLDAFFLTLLVVQAFGAAAVGRFSNLPLTYAGGLLVGVAASVTQHYVAGLAPLRGLPSNVPFLLLFGVLLVSRRGALLDRPSGPRSVETCTEPFPRPFVMVTVGAVLAGLATVPLWAGSDLPVMTNGVTFAIVFLALSLLVLVSGQISLCQAAFAAVGAAAFSHLTHGLGLPWGPALLLAGVAAVPVGAIIAVPAIRLSGVYLALATFGFGLLVERMVFNTGIMFGNGLSRPVPRPHLWVVSAQSDTAFYYVVLGIAVVSAVAVALLVRSRLGRLMRALGDSPVALDTLGTSVSMVKVLVFCVSAFLTAVAGGLLGAAGGAVGGAGFGWFQSLLWVTVLALAGARAVPAAVLAAGLVAVVPHYLRFGDGWQPLLFGVVALAVTFSRGRISWAAWFRAAADRSADRRLAGPAGARRVDPAFRTSPFRAWTWEGTR
jgi:branched-subunit amino acid ABC-type transport system permease component